MRRARRRTLAGAALAILGAVLVVVGWVGVRAGLAVRDAYAARAELRNLEGAARASTVRPGDSAVRRSLAAVEAHLRRAHRLTGDPLTAVVGRLPVVGCPLRAGAALAAAGDTVGRALPALPPAVDALTPQRDATGVRVDLAGVTAATPALQRAADAVEQARTAAAAAPTCGRLGARLGLVRARDDAGRQLAAAAPALRAAATAGQLLPALLGRDGTRRYLLVVQNDAEARATGGILGAYGVLTARAGRLALDDIASNSDLPQLTPPPPTGLGAAFDTRYRRFGVTRYWQDANLTPDFPSAAQLWARMWATAGRPPLDGVLALDPAVLGYLVEATRPVRLADGTITRGPDLVPLLESRIYAALPVERDRNAYFAAAGRSIYASLLADPGPPGRLLAALRRAAGEGRLLAWSRHDTEEAALRRTPVGGALPTARGPYLAVVTQDAVASKLDFWLRRATSYRLGPRRPDGSAEAVVTVRLTNTAPALGLPAYVAPGARNRVYTSVYGGVGAGFLAATLDGRPVQLESEVERGHGVFSTWVDLAAGQTRTLRLVLAEPVWRPELTLRPQPMVAPEPVSVRGTRLG